MLGLAELVRGYGIEGDQAGGIGAVAHGYLGCPESKASSHRLCLENGL